MTIAEQGQINPISMTAEEAEAYAIRLHQKFHAVQRYFIGADNSGHEYVVPVARTAEWNAWTALPDYDERSWKEPEFATRIDGGLTFTDPRMGE